MVTNQAEIAGEGQDQEEESNSNRNTHLDQDQSPDLPVCVGLASQSINQLRRSCTGTS